jgi:hypothetical protein
VLSNLWGSCLTGLLQGLSRPRFASLVADGDDMLALRVELVKQDIRPIPEGPLVEPKV